MAGPLALVGGDELKPGNEPQDGLLVSAAGAGPAFVLATAAARQRPELAIGHARTWFAGLGLQVEELPVRTPAQARSADVAVRAAEGRFFYLVGGDPGLVADVLRDSPVWEAIVGAWRGGAALAGSSAGAMAMAQWTLIRGRFPGDRERRYRDALGLVPRVAVLPHFQGFGKSWVPSALAAAPTEDVVLLGLDERAAAVWSKGAWRAMGGGVTVIKPGGERRFEAGEAIHDLPRPVGVRRERST
jgi:cyanophycinase